MPGHRFNAFERSRKRPNERNIKDLGSEMTAGESSGGRGRRFKSSHPDQRNQQIAEFPPTIILSTPVRSHRCAPNLPVVTRFTSVSQPPRERATAAGPRAPRPPHHNARLRAVRSPFNIGESAGRVDLAHCIGLNGSTSELDPIELLQAMVPEGAICYFTAIHFHELSTQMPSHHHIARITDASPGTRELPIGASPRRPPSPTSPTQRQNGDRSLIFRS